MLPFEESASLNIFVLTLISIVNFIYAYLIKRNGIKGNGRLFIIMGVLIFCSSYIYIIMKIPAGFKPFTALLNMLMGTAMGIITGEVLKLFLINSRNWKLI
ncbi:hypothetical protein J4731_00140 [Providencia rettgeri]|nr:hypothetical protein [Providencia rettgeri]